jgi:hypothetical protein
VAAQPHSRFVRRLFAFGRQATGAPASLRPGAPDLSPVERHEIALKQLIANAKASGANAERERIMKILDHPQAKKSAKLAWALAMTNSLDAEAALSFLEAAALDAATDAGQLPTMH